MPPSQTQVGSTSKKPVTNIPQIPLFVVRSPRDTYWRQGAYTTYTGTGWKRPTEWQPIKQGVPGDERTADARAFTYEVRLLQGGRSLPTAWQPETVRFDGVAAEAQVSARGGVRTNQSVPSNTTYLARSSIPPDDRDRLKRAGRDYPDGIERQYARAPEATDRVVEFTADLTENADTPYETAVVIRDWLQSNKPYSVNASHEAGEPIADQFLFEMERGFCVYYATTMAVMLRTQGIPARYVVGFAGGRPVGDNEYLVTSDRGHAWVEVYFPNVGWVRFDPTPGGSLPIADPQPPYNISLNRSAVAGAPVSISVEKNDSAVIGAPVYVNGERVGWSGTTGTVSTRLPYAPNVTITVRPPGTETKYAEGTDNAPASVSLPGGVPAVGGAPDARASRVYSLKMPSLGVRDVINKSSKTYKSETDVVLNVTGDLVVGGSAVINATIQGVPVRDATVTVDGDPAGKTNTSGLFVLSLDGVSPGSHEVTVTRNAVTGNGTFTVVNATRPSPTATPTITPTPTPSGPQSINISVTASTLFPLPAAPITVNVTRAGAAVPGASVRVGDEPGGETGPNGTLVISLPVTNSVTISASGPEGTTAKTTVSGLYRNAMAVFGGTLGLFVVVGLVARRYGITPRSISRAVSAAVSRLAARTVNIVLWLAEVIVRIALAIREGVRRIGTWLASLPRRLAENGLAALTTLDPRRLLGALRHWLLGLFRRAKDRVGDDEGPESGASRGANGADEGETSGAPPSLRELWREFVSLVRPPRLSTRTPGEIARYAIDQGLPEQPVTILTDLYRDAEYGDAGGDDSRLEQARQAIESIRETEANE